MPRFERPTLNPRLKCTLKCFDGWFSKKRALRADSLRSRFPRSLPECIPTKPTMTLTSCHGAKKAVFLVGRRRLPRVACGCAEALHCDWSKSRGEGFKYKQHILTAVIIVHLLPKTQSLQSQSQNSKSASTVVSARRRQKPSRREGEFMRYWASRVQGFTDTERHRRMNREPTLNP